MEDAPIMLADGVVDPLLQAFANWASIGMEFSMTVSCGGTIISGMAVCPETFGKRVAQQIRETGNEDARKVADSLEQSPNQTDDEQEEITATMLFMIDADVVGGAAIKGGLWRCRLDAVDAWFLGRCSQG